MTALDPTPDPWLDAAGARCAVTGICPVPIPDAAPHSGTMFLAVGLVLVGAVWLRRLAAG